MLRMADVRSGLLAVDACIVDSDDEYLVFSLRVPKEVIRENHPFLVAVSNSLGPIDARISPAILRRGRTWVSVAAGGLLLGAAFIVGLLTPVTAAADPPIDLININLVSSTIRPGDQLEIVATTRRRRVCMTKIDRLILRQSDDGLVAHEQLISKWHAVTVEPITRTFQASLPTGIPPGKYIYRSWVHSDCTGDGTYHQRHRDVTFEVVG